MAHDHDHFLTAESPPMEYDCPDCGDHNVLDPAELERLLYRRKFRCHRCRRFKRSRNESTANVTWNDAGRLVRICEACTALDEPI